MELELLPGLEHLDEIRPLFEEYTQMLVASDPVFARYLQLQHYDEELLDPAKKYSPPTGRLYLARCEGQSAGCIGLRRLNDESCEMKRLYLRPAFRGQGHGWRMIDRILSDARAIGYRSMLLDTLPCLETAVAMYRRLGFYEVPSYNDSPVENTLFLRLDL